MTPKRIREYLDVARAIDARLLVTIQAEVSVDGMTEPGTDSERLGGVEFWHLLSFVGADDPDGEGWEHYSEREGSRIRRPRFILGSGDVVTLKRARAMAAERRSA